MRTNAIIKKSGGLSNYLLCMGAVSSNQIILVTRGKYLFGWVFNGIDNQFERIFFRVQYFM